MTNMTKKIILIAVIAIIALGLAGYKFAKPDFSRILSRSQMKTLTPDQAKTKVLDYINNNLVKPGTKVSVKDVVEASGLYKIDLDVSGQAIVAYMTKDGSQFFPSAMDMNAPTPKAANGQQQQAAQKPIPKSDTPDIQLFVMSYCPYGTQMEKGILPVLAALGNKVNFNLEFVDYSMHNDASTGDQKELNENLRQYCIQKNQPDKLGTYLSCFLKSQEPGQEASCVAQSGVDAAQIATCMTATDNQYNVSKNFKDQSTYNGQFPTFKVDEADNQKYGVQGSPTLIINGVEDQAGNRDSASLLKDVCSAFNTAPDACNTKLSSTAPSPGFGSGTDTSGSSASCATK